MRNTTIKFELTFVEKKVTLNFEGILMTSFSHVHNVLKRQWHHLVDSQSMDYLLGFAKVTDQSSMQSALHLRRMVP
jgi:hypothetical protein